MPNKAEKKLLAIRRAEFALRQRLERIDFEHDELIPELEQFRREAGMKELPSEVLVEIIEEGEIDLTS